MMLFVLYFILLGSHQTLKHKIEPIVRRVLEGREDVDPKHGFDLSA